MRNCDEIKKAFILFALFASLSMNMLTIGIGINTITTETNNHQMPVWTSENIAVDKLHFTFSSPSDVKYFIFTDIFHLGYGYLSIGDLFVFFSTIMFFYSSEHYFVKMVSIFINRGGK